MGSGSCYLVSNNLIRKHSNLILPRKIRAAARHWIRLRISGVSIPKLSEAKTCPRMRSPVQSIDGVAGPRVHRRVRARVRSLSSSGAPLRLQQTGQRSSV